jgi:hypothetical protein
MRRCLLIAAFLLLTAPAAAVADGVVTTKLSPTPDSVRTGKPWKVTLTIHQQGRAARSDLRPSIQIRDADGFTSTFPATPAKVAGRYHATVRFSKPGQYTYVVNDGLSHTPAAGHSVVIKDPQPVVDRPDPVGPRGLPIALAGLLALLAGGYGLLRRHRQRVTGPLHPA